MSGLLVLVYFMQCLYGESLWLFVFVWKKTFRGQFEGQSAQVEKLREWQWKILKNSVCCFSLFLYLHDVLFCFYFLFFFFLRGKGLNLNLLQPWYLIYSLAGKVKKHLNALLSEQFHWKVAGTCPKQIWLIILSLMLFYT